MTAAGVDGRPGAGPSAALLVEVFPIGVPGRVVLQVSDRGPEPLSAAEQVRTLRGAAAAVEGVPADGGAVMPFTGAEQLVLRDAYKALGRVGEASRSPAYPAEHDHWHPVLDRAHQQLGVILALLAAGN